MACRIDISQRVVTDVGIPVQRRRRVNLSAVAILRDECADVRIVETRLEILQPCLRIVVLARKQLGIVGRSHSLPQVTPGIEEVADLNGASLVGQFRRATQPVN